MRQHSNPNPPSNVIAISGAGFDRWAFEERIRAADKDILPPRAKLLAFVLVSRVRRQSGEWTITVERLVAETGSSRRTIFRALNELERAGFLERTSRYRQGLRRASIYRLHAVPIWHSDHCANMAHRITNPLDPLKTGQGELPLLGAAVPGGESDLLGSDRGAGEASAYSPKTVAVARQVADHLQDGVPSKAVELLRRVQRETSG